MSNTPDRPGSIFRQEALDEFSGRMRGEVLRLPSIKARWLILFLGLWLSLLLLLALLPWREEFMLQANSAKTSSGEGIIEVVVPMHIAQDFIGLHPMLLANGRSTPAEFMEWRDAYPGAFQNLLARISSRYKLVTVVFKVSNADVIKSEVTPCRLTIPSTSLFDVVLLRLLDGAPAKK